MSAALIAACLAAGAWFAPQPSPVRLVPAPTNPARLQVAPQAQPHLDRVLEAVAEFLEVSVEDLGPARVRRPDERGNITVGPLRVPDEWSWGPAADAYVDVNIRGYWVWAARFEGGPPLDAGGAVPLEEAQRFARQFASRKFPGWSKRMRLEKTRPHVSAPGVHGVPRAWSFRWQEFAREFLTGSDVWIDTRAREPLGIAHYMSRLAPERSRDDVKITRKDAIRRALLLAEAYTGVPMKTDSVQGTLSLMDAPNEGPAWFVGVQPRDPDAKFDGVHSLSFSVRIDGVTGDDLTWPADIGGPPKDWPKLEDLLKKQRRKKQVKK